MAGMANASSAAAPATVAAGSYLTLHYRISLARTGDDVFSTFTERPATLTPAPGQLVEPPDRCPPVSGPFRSTRT